MILQLPNKKRREDLYHDLRETPLGLLLQFSSIFTTFWWYYARQSLLHRKSLLRSRLSESNIEEKLIQ